MNRFEVDGRPTVGGPIRGAGGGSFVPNQALGAQPAWFVDGSNVTGLAHNNNNGLTATTPVLTRGEIYRRLAGVTLTTNVTITVMSSLLPTDTFQSEVFGNTTPGAGFALNWVGVPTTTIPVTAITGYVAANGATNQVTQMTCAGLTGTFTALGLLNKIVEFSNGVGGFIWARVVADLEGTLGTRTAWISPPINQGLAPTNFINGQIVTFWTSLPNFNNPLMLGGFNTFKYLSGTNWQGEWGRNDLINCDGPARIWGGSNAFANCLNPVGADDGAHAVTVFHGTALFYGGYVGLVNGRGLCRVNAHATFWKIQNELGSFGTPGTGVGPANIEINYTQATSAIIIYSQVGPGRTSFNGFVYGKSATAALVFVQGGRDGFVGFSQVPTVTGASTVVFDLAGITELLTSLATRDLADTFNNRVVGPAGPRTDISKYEVALAARNVIAETFWATMQSNTTLLVAAQANFTGVGLRAGDIITNVNLVIFAAGIGLTVGLVGIYDKAGNRLAVSADQSPSWATTGLKVVPLTAPLKIPTTDMYYVGIFAAGATLPSVIRGNITTSIPPHVVGTGVSHMYGQAGVATLPNPAVFSTALTTVCHYFELT